jgi:hypothetical protein
METVTIDFSFPMTSREFGRFLVAAHDHFPEIKIVHVEAHYAYTPGKSIVSVSVPNHVAMLLKLEFGANIVKRPEIDFQKIVNIKLIKNRNTKNEHKFIRMDYSKFKFEDFKESFNEGLIIK